MINKEEVQLLVGLIEREIENLINVAQRTGKESWYIKVEQLRNIQERLVGLLNPNNNTI